MSESAIDASSDAAFAIGLTNTDGVHAAGVGFAGSDAAARALVVVAGIRVGSLTFRPGCGIDD